MQKIITSYDGVLIDTRFARAASWYFACSALRGVDPQIDRSLLESIEKEQSGVKGTVEELVSLEVRKQNIKVIERFVDDSTADVGRNVWRNFYVFDEEMEPSREDREFIREQLIPGATKIRDQFLRWFTKPIEENLKFFQQLYEAMRDTYHDEHPIGMITQLTTEEIKDQFYLQWNDREGHQRRVDHEFPFFRITIDRHPHGEGIGGKDPFATGFYFAECIGDNGIAYVGVDKRDMQKIGYHILCGKLGIQPGETITFEGTRHGVLAATKANIQCIGIKDANNKSSLMEAGVVVEGTLEKIVDAIPFLIRASPQEAKEGIKDLLKKEENIS